MEKEKKKKKKRKQLGEIEIGTGTSFFSPTLFPIKEFLLHIMAKSIRASVSKRNRANLRKKIAGPAVDARTERLAAKLQELASQPKPERPVKSQMEIETDDTGMSTAISHYFVTES